MKTMDGNNAAAYASYPFTDVAAIYPITPSSVMAEVTDKWSADGKKNLFGQQVKVCLLYTSFCLFNISLLQKKDIKQFGKQRQSVNFFVCP